MNIDDLRDDFDQDEEEEFEDSILDFLELELDPEEEIPMEDEVPELPEEEEHLQFDVDTYELLSKIENTTDTLFAPDRYIDVMKSDIDNL